MIGNYTTTFTVAKKSLDGEALQTALDNAGVLSVSFSNEIIGKAWLEGKFEAIENTTLLTLGDDTTTVADLCTLAVREANPSYVSAGSYNAITVTINSDEFYNYKWANYDGSVETADADDYAGEQYLRDRWGERAACGKNRGGLSRRRLQARGRNLYGLRRRKLSDYDS